MGSRDLAENGEQVVVTAVAAMDEINTASRKSTDIIGVIDSIAFQTNLLALNAAVEAARAGEQGSLQSLVGRFTLSTTGAVDGTTSVPSEEQWHRTPRSAGERLRVRAQEWAERTLSSVSSSNGLAHSRDGGFAECCSYLKRFKSCTVPGLRSMLVSMTLHAEWSDVHQT